MFPSTVIVSIGSNDVLQAFTFGAAPTTPAVFQANYHVRMETLALTHPNLIVPNIPALRGI